MQRFAYRTKNVPNVDRTALKQEILDIVTSHNMAPIYETVCQELEVPVNPAQLQTMKEANAAELQRLADSLKETEENAGETEVRDVLHARADYLADIMDREAAAKAYTETEAKTAGAGPKMDLAFSLVRVDIALGDWHAAKKGLDHARSLCDKGGDWERKNKLKVYDAMYFTATRQFERAANLLLDATATFTATEVMSYEKCVYYAVILSVVALDRTTLKARVVDNPDILSVIDTVPHLHSYLNSIYACDYAGFFTAFAGLLDGILGDMLLYPHFRYYGREARVVAYSQFLESYKSVTLQAMATAFGVSVEFMDEELAEFIVAGRVAAKIDKVAGVVETNRPDAKNALYQSAIKQGDHLLNRLQKLARVADIE